MRARSSRNGTLWSVSKHGTVRTDGCYAHQEPDGAWAYLCFYPDGTAGSITATDPPERALEPLRDRHPAMSFGEVQATSVGLKVETVNAEGSVLFRVTVRDDGALDVASRSRINGAASVIRYTFVPFRSERPDSQT